MASLKDQLDKATKDLNIAESTLKVREADTKDTRYGKFDPTSTAGKAALARLKTAGEKYNRAKAYYDNILAAYNKEQQNKKITGEQEGVSEEVQAARQGITVEQLRTNKQSALDAEKTARDATTQGAVDQQQAATFSQLLNTISVDEAQLKSVQEDLKKNFPSIYKGGVNGLKDWTLTQTALESIAERRGALPKNLQGASLREFLIKPTIDITTGAGGTGVTTAINISDPTEAATYVRSAFRSVLQRDPTSAEISKYTKILQTAEKRSPRKTVNGVTTGGLGSPVEFLTQEIQKLPEFTTKKIDKIGLTVQSISATAKANGITLGPDQINSFAKRIQDGTDIKVIDNEIRNIAGLGMPEKVQNLLSQGIDLSTIYSPYKNLMASVLELDPESIDLKDPTLRSAIGPDKEMPIYDFEKLLRKDYRWQYTDNAKRDVSNVALKVLRDFGFQA